MFIKMFTRFPLLNRDFLYASDQVVVKYRQHDANVHKNISRQFFIINEMLSFLAPAKIYPKALGKVLAMHFLGAVRLGRTADGLALFKGFQSVLRYILYIILSSISPVFYCDLSVS